MIRGGDAAPTAILYLWEAHPLCGRPIATAHLGGCITQQQAFQITGHQVHFKIDPPAWLVLRHDGLLQGMRDDIEIERITFNRIHRETGPVHGYRPLMCDVTGQFPWRTDPEANRARVVAPFDYLSQTIDMPRDQVPPEAGLQRQGLFQVYPATGLELSQRGQRQGLVGDIGRKPVSG